MDASRPLLRVGLTGGIASGKTTVARILSELGAFVLDADAFARSAMEPGASAYDRVVKRFGTTILDEDDFSDLAAVSFRKKLEASKYIGNRRLQIVDRRWREGRAETLEDTGATIEDLDMRGGFEMPAYRRPSGPELPDQQTPEGGTPPASSGNGNGNGGEQR